MFEVYVKNEKKAARKKHFSSKRSFNGEEEGKKAFFFFNVSPSLSFLQPNCEACLFIRPIRREHIEPFFCYVAFASWPRGLSFYTLVVDLCTRLIDLVCICRRTTWGSSKREGILGMPVMNDVRILLESEL